ncbi:MAG: helix-turn-helix domain-containing protein [Myxococcota bacterium]
MSSSKKLIADGSSPLLVKTRPSGHGRARGLVSSRRSGARVEAQTYEPPSELADVISAFWVGAWDLRGQPGHTTQMLPDPCFNFVFETGDQNDEARVVGVWTKLWVRTLEGRGRVRGIKLRPGAFRAFSDSPAHAYANRIVAFDSVFADECDTHVRDDWTFKDDERFFSRLARWLCDQRRDDANVSLAVALAQRVASSPEITQVAHLVNVSGLSLRPLQRLFRAYVGASPKWLIRRIRLQEVALRLERGDSQNLADLAAELGYTDQSHLARDFKSAVGKSATDFATAVWD